MAKSGRKRPPPGADAGDGSGSRGGDPLGMAQILAIADALPMGLAYVGRDRRYRFLNTALADFFDRSRRDVLGRTMDEMLGDAAMAERRPHLDEALAGKRRFFTADFAHPSRGQLTIQSDYLPQFAADGSVEGVVILVKDITEQKVAERALKESEARFRRIADSAPVMMWVTRLDRTRDFVNDAYAEFTGLDREQARLYDWRQSIHPDDVDRLVSESIAGEASLEPFTLEARYRRHDGEWRWLRSVSQPRFGPDGELIGFIGAAVDITIAKEAELELKEQVAERTRELAASEARVRAIFDTVLEVIVLLDPEGTIVEMNRIATPWRVANPERAIGLKIWDAPTMKLYPDQIPALRQAVAQAAGGEPFQGEIKLERPGMPAYYLDYSVQPVRDADGRIINLLSEARDITDLKAAQDQLRQSQKMEALGQLTGGLAHDFNNLLTVVVGGLDIIRRQVTDDRLKRYAANALTAAERGARLTAQLLAFSRVQRLEVRPIEVGPLVERMRPLLRNALGGAIETRLELATDAGLVMADPTQLELAVLNLAINARDAMPDGGKLTIASQPIRIDDDPELTAGDYLELSVGDNGSGMPSDVAARAFEPFFTTKDVGKGTGLGLSMVYGVARQSGGTARIASQAGEGTIVRLYLPRASEDAEAAAEEAAPTARKGRARDASVLVIDDDPDVRQFVCDSLVDRGYRVFDAVDGPTGLAAFARHSPDLVILDYAMPGMTGGEVAARLLADVPNQPLLFISGYSESEAIRQAAPGAALIAKPFRPEALDQAVREALRG